MDNANKRNFTTKLQKQILFYNIKQARESLYKVAMFEYVCYVYMYVGGYNTNTLAKW